MTAAGVLAQLAAGLIAGAVLVFGASLQQIGLLTTAAGKAGFITGLYVVLVPLFGLVWGSAPAGAHGWGRACGSSVFSSSASPAAFTIARGDLFVLVGSFFWAGHVQVVGWLSPRTDPVRLSCVQFAVCTSRASGGALFTEHPNGAASLPASGPILYGGLLSVGVAFTLQVVAQRQRAPAHAAILLSLERFRGDGGGAVAR